MRYRNRVTGCELETDCLIAGADWEAVDAADRAAATPHPTSEKKPTAKKPVKKTANSGASRTQSSTRAGKKPAAAKTVPYEPGRIDGGRDGKPVPYEPGRIDGEKEAGV